MSSTQGKNVPGTGQLQSKIVPAKAYAIPNEPLLSIEHPAIISSVDVGLRTLGGVSALSQAANNHADATLELRYRPDDIYQHSITSERVPAQNIVIKLTENTETKEVKQVEVVGVVDTILRFRSIADMQYHPYPDSEFAKKFEEAFTEMNYDKLSKFNISMEEDDFSNLDIMPPPIFSSVTVPQFYNYKQNSGLVIQNGRLAYRVIFRNKFITMVDKDVPQVPQAPSPHLDPLSTADSATQLCVTRLRELFAERPISTRRAVFNSYLNRFGPGTGNVTENWRPILRFCLPHVCYMFQSGPYRDAYMVYGLDPRKDSKWARYQTVFFNFRGGKVRSKVQESVEDLLKNSQNHLFMGTEINSQVVCYSCADIMDPMLKKLLDESPLRETFHEVHGWYPATTMSKVRTIMRGKLKALKEGRIPSDDEFLPILLDDSEIVSGPRYPTSITPGDEEEEDEQEEEESADEGDGQELAGENPETENDLNAQVDHLMKNLLEQSQEHQISSVATGVGRPKVYLEGEFEGIYGDDDDD